MQCRPVSVDEMQLPPRHLKPTNQPTNKQTNKQTNCQVEYVAHTMTLQSMHHNPRLSDVEQHEKPPGCRCNTLQHLPSVVISMVIIHSSRGTTTHVLQHLHHCIGSESTSLRCFVLPGILHHQRAVSRYLRAGEAQGRGEEVLVGEVREGEEAGTEVNLLWVERGGTGGWEEGNETKTHVDAM